MSVGGDRSELEKTLVDKVPARVVATTTGAIIGGPLGALVSAAAAPVIEYVLSTGNQRLIGNAGRIVDTVAEIDGRTPSEMLHYARADDERLALLLATVLAAMETLSEPRLRTLAYVLADGFSDDARLDVSRMYVHALRSLETYHVRVLDHLDRVFRNGTDELSTSCDPDELAAVFPGLGPALHPDLGRPRP